MTDRLLQTGAWVVVGIILCVMLINAVCMLVLPQAWYSLPPWLRFRGPGARELQEDRWSPLLLRVLGAVMIAAVTWFAFDLTRNAGFP
jgi:hypothetical protein